jgi:hypothetical protein
MKAYKRMDVYTHVFLTSALAGGGQLHVPVALPPGRFPGTHRIAGWVDPRAGLDDVKKRKFLTLPGLELRPLGRPTRSQSLYRLCNPYIVYKYKMRFKSWGVKTTALGPIPVHTILCSGLQRYFEGFLYNAYLPTYFKIPSGKLYG